MTKMKLNWTPTAKMILTGESGERKDRESNAERFQKTMMEGY